MLLAMAMIYIYATVTPSVVVLNAVPGSGVNNLNPQQQIETISKELFLRITGLQLLLWMLIAPSLTAPAIAGEREHGLLEGLQLSEITPLRIVWGKLISSLSFIAILLVVSLPVTSICFVLGGLSPGDFIVSVALQLVTVLTCSAIGLYFSARSHRTFTALRSTFVVMLFWACGSAWVADQAWYWVRSWAGLSVLDKTYALSGLAFGYTNPLLAATSLMRPSPNPFPPGTTAAFAMASIPPWAVCIALQFIISLVLLRLAAHALHKPLPTPRWVERKRWHDRLRSMLVPPEKPHSTAHSPQQPTLPRKELRQRAGKALMHELPLERLAHFTNPVLRREVRSKFRLRQASFWTLLMQVPLTIIVVASYMYAGFLTTDAAERAGTWSLLSNGGLVLVILVTAIMSAGSFSREREVGTWEGLSLSLLSPAEIIYGKVLTPLVMCCYGFVVMLPVLLPCALLPRHFSGDSVVSRFLVALVTVLIVASTAWCCTAWGLLISWMCRRTAAAISWTLATLFLALVVFPLFVFRALLGVYYWLRVVLGSYDMVSYSSGDSYGTLMTAELGKHAFHPWYALEGLRFMQEQQASPNTLGHYYYQAYGRPAGYDPPNFLLLGSINVVIGFSIGALLLLRLYFLIKKETRERNKNRGPVPQEAVA